MAIYLGFDCSTQSLTALAIEVDGARRAIVFERSLRFDEAFPEYGTCNGVLPDPDPRVATTPPALWADALDRMMGLLRAEAPFSMDRVRAISGSGQQHGSVYLAGEAARRWAALDPARPLADQLAGTFTRAASPIWMDASTTAQCAEITARMGGASRLAAVTGSRAFERFTGPQIRRFHHDDPEAYARTARIHLVSSFLASLLAGRDAPIDPGDGAGMNLLDLAHGTWSPEALEATAPRLGERLPPVAPASTVVGALSEYWQRRHGFPAAKVAAWSGDNPCSLIGTGITREGRVAVSLGTSDTVFGYMTEPRVDASGTGHVFGAPTGAFMGLTCFRNGSLARERIARQAGLGWDAFSAALRDSAPGNGGAVMLPWFETEITPAVPVPGVRCYGLDTSDVRANVRAVVEGQMLAMARHSAWMGVRIDTIHATGGASANRDILQVMADVFDAEVLPFEVTNSAALGAALRAYHADRLSDGMPVSWDDVTEGIAEPLRTGRIAPRKDLRGMYDALRTLHEACERHALGQGPDPAPLVARFRQARG